MRADTHSMTTLSSTPLFRRVLGGMIAMVTGLVTALLHRREVHRLTELDDRTLKDIGLLPSDVAGALAEPFHKDPSRILMVRSVERRARARALDMKRKVEERVRETC